MPLLECRKLKIHSFPHFILTRFNILSWYFAFDFYCTRDQVWVSSISVNFCRSYAPFWNLEYWNTHFSALFSYMLWYIKLKFCIWLSFTVLQIKFQCCQFPSISVGVMPLLERRILEIQFSALFSCTLWHIELKFCIWFCFTLLQIKFQCCQFRSIFVGVMPLVELRILKIGFRTFLLHALTYWTAILHMTLFNAL